jgi:choline dehydrogenase-like flavoprotein
MAGAADGFDFDWLIVGSGFGGSVSALRRFLWAPAVGLRGILRLTPFKDVFIASGAWLRKQRRTFTARGVVMSAGALGTNRLLAKCKLTGVLPRISDRLGQLVRTNSESVLAVTLPKGTSRPWHEAHATPDLAGQCRASPADVPADTMAGELVATVRAPARHAVPR